MLINSFSYAYDFIILSPTTRLSKLIKVCENIKNYNQNVKFYAFLI